LIEHQTSGLSFELGRKGTTLLGHQTPLYGEYSRPKWVSGISRPLHGRPVNAGPSEQRWSEGTRRNAPGQIEGQAFLATFVATDKSNSPGQGEPFRQASRKSSSAQAVQAGGNKTSQRKSPAQDRAFSQSAEGSVDLGVQLPTGITLEHAFQRDRLDLRGVAGSAEGFVTGDADVAHGIDGLRQILARIELGLVLCQEAADRAGGGQTQVGIDVHLAHAVLDALDDFLDRHAV